MKTKLKIPKSVFEVVKRQAEAEAPLEACGYLAGKGGQIEVAYPMANIDRSADHFSLDPREQFSVLKHARAEGLELVAVYHSHPASPARMSDEDIRLACDPGMIYVIYSLCDDEIKGFRKGADDVMDKITVETQS